MGVGGGRVREEVFLNPLLQKYRVRVVHNQLINTAFVSLDPDQLRINL